MMEKPSITAALIASGRPMRLTPRGKSMLPLLDGEKDSVLAASFPGLPRKGDVVLYRDRSGALAVHRVIRVDKAGNCCDLLGDGNLAVEKAIPGENIYGRVERICRRGKDFSVRHPLYRLYGFAWVALRRYRKKLFRLLKINPFER